ncbi:MAG: DUF2177 family protein [Candidatus Shapirobacteria bacterium]|jgi:uncharacterized membrane protein
MFIKLYGIALPIFLIIDGMWLGLVAKNFYAKQLGYLMTSTPNWAAAGIFYLLYIVGLVVLVIEPAMNNGSIVEALLKGALFGLVGYATYDLTNLATIKDWPLLVTIVDLIWGTVLSATISTLTVVLAKKIGL